MGLTNNLGKLSNMITSTGSAVGIGTTSPTTLLQLSTARTNGTNVNILTLSDTTTGSQTVGFGTRIQYLSGVTAVQAAIGLEQGGTGTNNESQISFYTQNTASALTKQLTIGSTGTTTLFNTLILATTQYIGNIQFGTASTATLGYDAGAGLMSFNIGAGAASSSAYYQFSADGSAKVTILKGGNVGIGIAAPSYTLSFNGDVATTIGMNQNTTGAAVSLTLKGADGPNGTNNEGGPIYISSGIGTGNGSTSNIIFSTAPSAGSGTTRQTLTERMRITSTGNVGIGMTPDVNLQVKAPSGNTTTFRIGPSASGFELSQDNGGLTVCTIKNIYSTTNSAAELSLQSGFITFKTGTSLAEYMRISSAGNVAIGNTSASQPLHVTVAAGVWNATIAQQSNLGGFLLVEANSSGTNSRASIVMRGSDGIGGGLSVARESPSGGWQTYMTFYTNNVTGGNGVTSIQEKLRISSDGSLGANGSTTNIYNASDRRLKQNITPINYGLDAVLNMKPISFNWADGFQEIEKDKTMLGFIAQDMELIVPEAVETFSKTPIELNGELIEDSLTINQKYIIPILVKAIQEQQATITELTQKVNALENK
jgi:hypothetical protein